MPALEVLTYGHPYLRKRAREISVPDKELTKLAADMIETMILHEGVGLAAPQVGFEGQLIVIDAGRLEGKLASNPMVLINPRILSAEGQSVYREGCLSIPGVYADVKRPESITVKYLDLNGQMFQTRHSGVEARIIQHEMDHLNGILFIDRLNPVTRWLMNGKLNRLKKSTEEIPSNAKVQSITA